MYMNPADFFFYDIGTGVGVGIIHDWPRTFAVPGPERFAGVDESASTSGEAVATRCWEPVCEPDWVDDASGEEYGVCVLFVGQDQGQAGGRGSCIFLTWIYDARCS